MRSEMWRFATVITMLTIVAVTVLVALGKSTQDVLYVFGAAGIPTVAVLLGAMHNQVGEVKSQVNGRFSQLIQLLEKTLERQANVQEKLVDNTANNQVVSPSE